MTTEGVLDEVKIDPIEDDDGTSRSRSVGIEYDPKSLQEPEGFHDWKWLPSRILKLFLHEAVKQVGSSCILNGGRI